jgi:hypothetical protein
MFTQFGIKVVVPFFNTVQDLIEDDWNVEKYFAYHVSCEFIYWTAFWT